MRYSILLGLMCSLFPRLIFADDKPKGAVLPWIKLGWSINELPVFQAKINGQSVRVLFDTGCSSISMSPEMARHLKIKTSNDGVSEMGWLAGGKRAVVHKGTVNNFEIAGHIFRNLSVIIIPGSKKSWVDATVGVALLQRTRILMDYDKRRTVILKKPFLVTRKSAVKIPFRIVTGHNMIVKATVDDKPLYLDFDTGATFTLELRRYDASILGLHTKKTKEYGQGGAGQPVKTTFFEDELIVCLGSICKKVRPISLNEPDAMWKPKCHQFGNRISGVLSHNFLIGVLVEYDFSENVIWLWQKKSVHLAPKRRR